MRGRAKRASLGIVAVAIVALASGCKVSERNDFVVIDTGASWRCASGLAAVAEAEDRNDDGTYSGGAVTQANKDLFCSNEDTVSPGWSSIKADAKLIYYVNSSQVAICANAPTATATGSAHQAISVASGRCGSNRRYYTAGYHYATTTGSSYQHSDQTFSPEVTNP